MFHDHVMIYSVSLRLGVIERVLLRHRLLRQSHMADDLGNWCSLVIKPRCLLIDMRYPQVWHHLIANGIHDHEGGDKPVPCTCEENEGAVGGEARLWSVGLGS